MGVSQRVVRWLGMVLSGWCVLAGAVWADTLELTQARAAVTVGGSTHVQDLTLPYHWDRYNKGQAGEAVFELQIDLPVVPAEPWGLYLPRLGNAYEIWLNGTLLQRQGNLLQYNGADYSQVPRFVAISPGLLQSTNRLRLHIRADVGRRGGVSQLVLGPYEETYSAYMRGYHLRGTGSLAVASFSLLVGLMALSLWVTQTDLTQPDRPRRDALYLFAGLAELSWAFGVGYALIEEPPLPWPWWGVLPVVAAAAWMCWMMLFCIEVAGWTPHRIARLFRRWLYGLLGSSVLLSLGALGLGLPLALTLWYATMGATALCFGLLFLRNAVHHANLAHRAVALALLLNVLAGIRDLYVFRIQPSYGEITWIRYSSVFFGLTLGYIVITRFRMVSKQARESMNTLTSRIAQRERELNSSYQRLEQLARDQERTSERTRILRDMHDGVGSHISAAIRQLQSGRASSDDVLQTLRGSLDQLKLTIDAMHLPHGDVTALLANLRYRLEPRFSASDVELQWGVDLMDPIHRLDAQAMRHLQFMVFEALSNVLQHAQASWLRIEAAMTPEGARLRIVDNGRGFDVSTPPRKGLASLRERAHAIGAWLHMDSAPGRTVIEILIPIT